MTAAARAFAPTLHPAPARPVPSAGAVRRRVHGSRASSAEDPAMTPAAATRACPGPGAGTSPVSPTTAHRVLPPYATVLATAVRTLPDAYARLARGCRPRGCRAPARRVHGRRVRYVIGDEPGQVNGMRWRARRTARRLHHR